MNQYKKFTNGLFYILYDFILSLPHHCVFYCTYPFRLAAFQVLSSHMGLLAITVDCADSDLISVPPAGLTLSSLFLHAPLCLEHALHLTPTTYIAGLTSQSGHFLLEIRPGPFSPG